MRRLKIGVAVFAALALVAVPTAFIRVDADNNAQLGTGDQARDTQANIDDIANPNETCKRQSAGNKYIRDIFLSTGTPRTYSGDNWQDVDCANTTFQLRYRERALVTADFNAEADCNGTTPANGQWCLTRALLNGQEGEPVANEPSSYAFDNVAVGTQNWQAHAMNRAWEVTCEQRKGCQYKFAVQTRMHDASVTSMWLDEIAAHISIVVGRPVPL